MYVFFGKRRLARTISRENVPVCRRIEKGCGGVPKQIPKIKILESLSRLESLCTSPHSVESRRTLSTSSQYVGTTEPEQATSLPSGSTSKNAGGRILGEQISINT